MGASLLLRVNADEYRFDDNLVSVRLPDGSQADFPMADVVTPCKPEIPPKALWGSLPVHVLFACDDWALVASSDWRRPQVVTLASMNFEADK